jgi:hypothetical protein
LKAWVLRGPYHTRKHVSGVTWEVYIYILTAGPVGVRDVWRTLKLSSPSLAQYHVNKLLELKVVNQTRGGKYIADKKEQMEALRDFIVLRGKLIPRLVFYGALISGIFTWYLLFWSFEWNFRDLVVLGVSVISIFVFFFEAYNQYRSLKASVRKV